MNNFLTPLAETRLVDSKGYGSFATQIITKGTIVATFGGLAANRRELATYPDERQRRSMQIDFDLYLVGPITREPGDSINHSCAPNCGMRNATQLVAMNDIDKGTEITFDYAMSDTSTYDQFVCSCAAPHCRGSVSGEDWRRDDVCQSYAGFFSPHVQRLIDSSKSARRLSKRDVERLLAAIDDSPFEAVLGALRIVIGFPDATWKTSINLYCKFDGRELGLLNYETDAIDRLATELNETRGDFYLDRAIHR
ncbi:MAG: SET domain-containing protein-lysine N-methyltransferase [Ilumatobacteraceae bacterium]